MVSFAVDGEGYSDAVFIEPVWPNVKVSDEKDRSGQSDMNRAREYQEFPPGIEDHRRRSISRLCTIMGICIKFTFSK